MGRQGVKTSPPDIVSEKKAFIDTFLTYGTVSCTLTAIKVSPSTCSKWRKTDPEFEQAYQEQLALRRDTMVSILYRIGRGLDKPKSHGQLTALYGWLKATDHLDTRPDRLIFVDRSQVELTGKGGGPLDIVFVIGKGYKKADGNNPG